MISESKIMSQYDIFSEYSGYNLREVVQGDDLWHRTRLGVITSSNAYKIISPTTDTYKTYLKELVCQIVTGAASREPINTKYFDWGHANETEARREFSFQNNFEIKQYPFIFMEGTDRVGFSPDGVIHEEFCGVEFKAPYTSKFHLDLFLGDMKPEYYYQVQFSMMVLDCDRYHFVSYDPDFLGNELFQKVIYRNEKTIKLLMENIEIFLYSMDKILDKLDTTFSSKWSIPIKK